MKLSKMIAFFSFTLMAAVAFGQEEDSEAREGGHINNNKFRQMYQEFSSPNMFRSASGAPGPAYYQQQADYVMDIELDDKNAKLYGNETITYTNNSPDPLDYLWVQLDQNVRAKDSPSPLIEGDGVPPAEQPGGFAATGTATRGTKEE